MMVTDAIKIRAQVQGEFTEIRVLMQHPMETGQRKDERGQTLPAQFIQTFTISHNGKPIIDGQLNTAISRNPLFAFRARGIKPGDKITVAWMDNRGDQRSDDALVA